MTGRVLSFLVFVLVGAGCGSSDESSDDGGPSSTGGCTGDVAQCPLGELSSDQRVTACEAIQAEINEPIGTRYTCHDGGAHDGLFLAVNSKAQCEATVYKAGCKLTYEQVLDCYKQARKDVCGSLAAGGACAVFLSGETQATCVPQ